MKKYWEALLIAFKTRTAYRFDTAMQVLSGVARVLFAWLLWTAIFKGRDQVAGFTLDTMILYYLIQSFFAQMDNTGRIAEELSSHIRAGTFSKFLVLPIKVQPYLFAQNLGSAAYMVFFSLATSALSLLAFKVTPEWTMLPLNWAKAAALLLLGRVFLSQMNFFLGILTLKYQDIWLFLMIKNNVLAFLFGTLVPLTLMPEAVLKLMRLTPFYHATHLPAMLLLNRGGNEAPAGMLVLILWIAIFYFLNKQTYANLRTRYDGVGI
jgi:ABC-2 type transport system permease protein